MAQQRAGTEKGGGKKPNTSLISGGRPSKPGVLGDIYNASTIVARTLGKAQLDAIVAAAKSTSDLRKKMQDVLSSKPGSSGFNQALPKPKPERPAYKPYRPTPKPKPKPKPKPPTKLPTTR